MPIDKMSGHQDRTLFAAERTYAAWVRTGLVAMASGIGAKALLADFLPHWLVMTSGSVFILFSVFCFGAGVWRHLYPGPPPPVPDASRIHPAILVCVNSILGLVSIAALVGIWLDPGQRSTGIGLPDILSIEDARTLTQCQCPTAFRRSQTQYRARWAPCFRIRGNNC